VSGYISPPVSPSANANAVASSAGIDANTAATTIATVAPPAPLLISATPSVGAVASVASAVVADAYLSKIEESAGPKRLKSE
jgi:hypothetical protein